MIDVSAYWDAVDDGNTKSLKSIFDGLDSGEFINSTLQNGLNALHKVCITGDLEMAKELLEMGVDVNMREGDSYTALHHACCSGYEDLVRILLEKRADYEIITEDRSYYVSGTAIYLSGGQTCFHLAAMHDSLECVKVIHEWMKNNRNDSDINEYMDTKDNDGSTAFDLACMAKAFSVCEYIISDSDKRMKLGFDSWPPSDRWVIEKRGVVAKIQAARIVEKKKQQKFAQLAMIKEKYSPLCEILTDDEITPKKCFDFLLSDELAFVLKMNDVEGIRKLVEEPIPGLFVIEKFLNPEAVLLLRNEFANFLDSKLPLERPNESIPFGFKVDATGLFNGWLKILEYSMCKQIAPQLFPKMKELKSSYTFVKNYLYGKDTKPSTHYDPSELTFSVCLGDEFTGSEVYFHNVQKDEICPRSTRTPHPDTCTECEYKLSHKPGQAVFHVGKHIHGVYHLTSGERWQMIMWLYGY